MHIQVASPHIHIQHVFAVSYSTCGSIDNVMNRMNQLVDSFEMKRSKEEFSNSFPGGNHDASDEMLKTSKEGRLRKQMQCTLYTITM